MAGPAVKVVVSIPNYGEEEFHKPIHTTGEEDYYTALARSLRSSVKTDINRILSVPINEGKKRRSENTPPSKKAKKIIV